MLARVDSRNSLIFAPRWYTLYREVVAALNLQAHQVHLCCYTVKGINLTVVLKSDDDIATMRSSCKLAAATLRMIASYVRAGVSTLELNDICHDFTLEHGAVPAPLHYKGFPKSICTSINEVICHGIPHAEQRLKDGDIINIDVTPIVDGYHGDSSVTFIVGEAATASREARLVTQCARECLYRAIEVVKVGKHIGDIGATILAHADSYGFSVVRDFVGHGIGKTFHEEPQIPHFGVKGNGLRLCEGMVFTIEPMINVGTWKACLLDDGWTAVTVDGKLSAQFEHTIAILSDGSVEILTADNEIPPSDHAAGN